MNQTAIAIAIGAVVAGLVVLFVGGAGLRVSVSSGGSGMAEPVDGPLREPPADGSFGLVYSTSKTKAGLSVFGWDVVSSRFAASVGFVPPRGCEIPATGELVAEGACAGIPAAGPVSGGGTTSDGHDLVIVSVTVSKACHDALRGANASPVNKPLWPSDHAACRDD